MEDLNDNKQGFDFKKFIEDSKTVFLKPKDFFEKMPTKGGYTEPVIKVLIYGVVIGFFSLIWSLTGLTFSPASVLLGGSMGTFIIPIIKAFVGLFIGGIVMLIISAIFGGNTDYEANVRVVSAIMIVPVVSSAFIFLDGISLFISAVISIAISLWGLYITYYALVSTLKTRENGTKILLIVFAIIITIMDFAGIAAKKAMENFRNGYNIENMTSGKHQEAALKMVEKLSDGKVKAKEMKKLIDEKNKTKEDQVANNAKYTKTSVFPEKFFTSIKENLSSNELLNKQDLKNSISFLTKIQNIDTTGMTNLSETEKNAKIDSIAKTFGFANLDEVVNKCVKPALLSASILTMVGKIDPDKIANSEFIKDFISQNPVSYNDLKFTYDNWNMIIKLEAERAK